MGCASGLETGCVSVCGGRHLSVRGREKGSVAASESRFLSASGRLRREVFARAWASGPATCYGRTWCVSQAYGPAISWCSGSVGGDVASKQHGRLLRVKNARGAWTTLRDSRSPARRVRDDDPSHISKAARNGKLCLLLLFSTLVLWNRSTEWPSHAWRCCSRSHTSLLASSHPLLRPLPRRCESYHGRKAA